MARLILSKSLFYEVLPSRFFYQKLVTGGQLCVNRRSPRIRDKVPDVTRTRSLWRRIAEFRWKDRRSRCTNPFQKTGVSSAARISEILSELCRDEERARGRFRFSTCQLFLSFSGTGGVGGGGDQPSSSIAKVL